MTLSRLAYVNCFGITQPTGGLNPKYAIEIRHLAFIIAPRVFA